MGHPVRTASALLLASLLALTSCNGSGPAGQERPGADAGGDQASGGGGAGADASDPPGGSAPPAYLVLERSGWKLTEAIDYRSGLGRLEDFEPDLDWFAEYDGPRADRQGGSFVIPAVSVSAHTLGLDARRKQLRHLSFEPTEVAGRKALAGEGPNGPRMVILDVAPGYSVDILSYDLPLGALRELAGHLRAVGEQEWIAHGGVLLDCVPFEAGCQGPGD